MKVSSLGELLEEIESCQDQTEPDDPHEETGKSPVLGDSKKKLRPRLISSLDKEYLEALSLIGYRRQGRDLLQRAYRAKESEVENRRWLSPPTEPLTDLDIEYLEALILLGDRKSALIEVHKIIDQHEIRVHGQIMDKESASSPIDQEYLRIMEMIDRGQTLRNNEKKDGHEILYLLKDIFRSLKIRSI